MDDILATPVLDEINDQANREVVRWCHGCTERAESDTMTAPCGHPYCHGCIIRWFSLAGKYESIPRPHCCGQPITLEDAGSLLPSDISEKFLAKAEEISSTNRIYCWDPECATFISPKAIDGRQRKCPSCRELTCIVCKKAFHEGGCFEEPPAQSIMTAAAEAGFMQCFKCKRMVELDKGCRHITCICRAEFCYVCGAKWKTCFCPDPLEQVQGNVVGQADQVADPEEWEEMMNFALENVEAIHEDGRIEWMPHAAAAAAAAGV